jgi:4-hydroxy-tetrahydrodipicolinate synthase
MAKNKAPERSSNAGRASGVYADLATPRRADSTEADAAAFLDYLDYVARAGAEGARVDGLVLFGSTGEFIHFDVAERMRAAALAIRRSRVPVLIGVSHSTVVGALELAEHAITIKAAGVLLMPAYFYSYPEDQIFHFYERFAQNLDGEIPIYLHNSALSANPMSAELMRRLLETGAFAGILNEQSAGLALSTASPHSMFSGDEALVASSELASGIVSAIAAALPELPVALHRALARGETQRSEELGRDLEEFRSRMTAFPAIVALKQAAIARGWMRAYFAVPPDAAMQARLQSFQEWFTRWLPGVLSKCATKV